MSEPNENLEEMLNTLSGINVSLMRISSWLEIIAANYCKLTIEDTKQVNLFAEYAEDIHVGYNSRYGLHQRCHGDDCKPHTYLLGEDDEHHSRLIALRAEEVRKEEEKNGHD